MVIISHATNHLRGGVMPVLYPTILDEFHLSYVQLGLLRFAYSFASGFPQMFISFFRRWLPGRILLGVGNLITVSMDLLASLTSGFRQFISVRIVGGVGVSPQHAVGASIITTNSDPSWRGRALGLNLAVPNLASALAPLIAAALLTSLGWRMALRLIAIPALAASVFILLFVKDRGFVVGNNGDSYSFKGLLDALKIRNVLAISAVRMVMAFRMGIRAFIPLYFIDVLGLNTGLSSFLYSVMIFGGVLGPFFWGWLSDRMNRKPIVVGILVCSSMLFFSLNLVKDILLLALLLFFIGFMAQTVVLQNILAESAEGSQLDQVFGFYFTLGFTLGSISSVIFGYIVDALGFGYAYIYIAAVTAVSLLPALFITETRASLKVEQL